MDSEIRIPTDRVPPEILQKLKEIGLLLQSETATVPLSSSTTSKTPSGVRKKEADECDDLEGTGSIVHVLGASRVPEVKKDNDVVSLFSQSKNCHVVSLLDTQTDSDAGVSGYDQRKDSDSYDRRNVVSVFDHRMSPDPKDTQSSCAGARLVETTQEKESELLYENRLSPQKDLVNQNPRFFQQSRSLPQVSLAQTAPLVCSQGGQQYCPAKASYPQEVPDNYSMFSHHRSTQPLSGEMEEEGCGMVVSGRSPCKTPKRYEDTARQHHASFVHRCNSPSMSELASSSCSSTITNTTVSTSTSSQSFCSRPSPSMSRLNEDNQLRGVPAVSVTPSADVGGKSPKVLTPPETPENDGKQAVPEVFTFDDLAITQERFRQTLERLNKLQDQFTPTKRSPSTPRAHPPSTPPTPSFRRLEPGPPTTPVRRISPVDSHFLQQHRMEAAAVSPQPKLKMSSDLPASPALTSTPQRISVTENEYSSSPQLNQRRSSVSPKPKKRLSFEEDGGSSHHMLQAQHQRLRRYDPSTSTAAYPIPSPWPSGSTVDTSYSFPPWEGQQHQQPFGRGTSPGKNALPFMDIQKKLASLHEGRACVLEFDEDDERRGDGPFFSGMRHVYESIEFQNRLAMQNGRYTPKRKRSERFDDGSDGIAQCTCAVMERNFLQMAECAYKRIRRMDATPEDFDRFRNELAQTNDILRESMGLMKHIRDICDHRKRPRW